ncbi:MAG: sigma-70 family RNA polymerase sigma factor [Elusimicrobiales bacterium]
MNSVTDAVLVAAFRDGDAEAFEALYRRHEAGLYSFVLAMVKDEAAASDIFQETFIRVFRNIDKYSEEGKFKGWLYRTASNLAMDHFRRASRLGSFLPDGEDEEAPQREPSARGEEPEILLDRLSDGEAVAKALDALPPEQKEVVLMREYSGMSFKEIAQATGAPLGTVLARMSRAVRKMRAALEKGERLPL